MLTRRFFIGGAASAAALGARGIFAAAPGTAAAGRANLKFGVVSDVHIGYRKGGKKLHEQYDTGTFKATLRRFRDAGADAVVIAGDMSHFGIGPELVALGEAWFEVFPGSRAPDGRKVEPVFVTGNHDNGDKRAKFVFDDENDLKANIISNDTAKWWDLAFHEEWKPIYKKEVKGYSFVGAHWVIGDCRGIDERFNNAIPGWYAENGRTLDPSKPFFHIQHPHPKGTVHGTKVWGQDNGESTRTLSAYPNAIAFSGHSHNSLTDERSIWQGAFTSVGCATLRNVKTAPEWLKVPKAGFENYRTPKALMETFDPIKAMAPLSRFDCRHEQFLSVYDDRVVFSRREAISGEQLGDDLVMPLPAAERKPFDHKLREAKAMAPEFPAAASLEVTRAEGKLRGAKGAKKTMAEVWKIVIPQANALKNTVAASYEIEVLGDGGEREEFSVINDGFRFPPQSARARKDAIAIIACSRIKPERFTLKVRAVSCWGLKSAPLEFKV